MAKQSIDPEEQRLINYLLGMTSAEEAEPIENRYFSDPNYHEQLLALEDELIHAYLRRELPAHQQQAFEDYFLASERRQKKFLATRDLLSYVDQLPPTTAKTSSVGVPTTKKTGWFTLPSFPRLIGATAVLLALAVCGWWFWSQQQSQIQSDIAQTAVSVSPSPALPNQPIQEADNSLPAPQAPAALADKPQMTVSKPIYVVAFALPGTRDTAEKVTVTLPAQAETVQAQIALSETSDQRYELVLKTTDGERIWQQQNLSRQTTRLGLGVITSLPANRLQTGETYVLDVKGISSTGESRFLEQAFLLISKK